MCRLLPRLLALFLGLVLLSGCALSSTPDEASTQVRVRGQWDSGVSKEHRK